MLFNSYIFLLGFLPLALLGFSALTRRRARAAAVFLVAASLLFYAWSSPWYHVAILLASISFNFKIGKELARSTSMTTRRLLLFVGIGFDLGLLGYFKYVGFVLEQFGYRDLLPHLVLPLGISFYTFTQIAYLVDTFRRQAREYDRAHYALFVTWFPHLIAGPILHHKEMMPQFGSVFRERIQPALVMGGFSIFVVGLAKKVLLADQFAPFADSTFQNATHTSLTFLEAWIGTLAYTLQIYFDFSGYSDMAIGLSLAFGVRLPSNFNSPYKAASIIDFWRRWHMTLSRFLRDYVYIPLGGSRKGQFRRYVNLLVTMLIGGLWHGAGWTFIVWGGLHGLYLIINHAWNAAGFAMPRPLGAVLTFGAVAIAWVFFRATDFPSAFSILQSMALGNGLSMPRSMSGLSLLFGGWDLRFDGSFHNNLFRVDRALFTIFLGLAIVWLLPNTQDMFRQLRPVLRPVDETDKVINPSMVWRPNWQWGCALGLLLAASFVTLGGDSPFLYFRF
jgi:D-alanyl-lipoteichoic acid acyltransferase DltB (MBOAT superfamily)